MRDDSRRCMCCLEMSWRLLCAKPCCVLLIRCCSRRSIDASVHRLSRDASARMYAPFDRNQWLERNAARRKEEWKSLHTEKLIRVSPQLRYKQQMGRLKTATFLEAVDAYKSGGDLYASWSAKKHQHKRVHRCLQSTCSLTTLLSYHTSPCVRSTQIKHL